MKRAHSDPKRSAWQQPASCEFCRLKKIRCDKNRPCHNCISRDIECRYASSPTSGESSGDAFPSLSDSLKSLERHMLEINLRLQRLEAYLISNMEDTSQSRANPTAVSEACGSSNDIEGRQSIKTWEKLEAIAASPALHDSDNVVQQSESSTREDDALNILSDQSKQLLTTHDRPYSKGKENKEVAKLIQRLPDIQLAQMLFDYYARMVNNFHHEIDITFARSLLETTYCTLHHPQDISKEDLAFLFCIFASSLFYILQSNSHFLSGEVAGLRVSHNSWKEIALELALSRDAMLSLSLISLQTVCIMFDLVWDSEGQSPSFHLLKSVATNKAIQMKLHRLDSDTHVGARDTVEIEIKRRLWWHLASTDWIVGSIPGPYEGIYAIHPQHMSVEYPAAIDDETAVSPQAHIVQSERPTSMSFFIQRARFAVICREVMDSLRNFGSMKSESDYQQILQLSEKFESFSNQLPWFFQLEAGKRREAGLLAHRYPYIARQRSALLYALYARLGRIHRPYFLQGLQSAEYSVSRKTAVSCAEKLLELHAASEPGGLFPYVHSYSMDQHLFSVLLIQIIDIMADQDEARAQIRMVETFEICRKLEEKQKTLNPAGNGTTRAIQKLIEILKTDKRFQHAFENRAEDGEQLPIDEDPNSGMVSTGTVHSIPTYMESDFGSSAVPPSFTRSGENSQETSAPILEAHSPPSQFSFEDIDISDLWEEFIANFPSSPNHFRDVVDWQGF